MIYLHVPQFAIIYALTISFNFIEVLYIAGPIADWFESASSDLDRMLRERDASSTAWTA